jgi:hypothetical protein
MKKYFLVLTGLSIMIGKSPVIASQRCDFELSNNLMKVMHGGLGKVDNSNRSITDAKVQIQILSVMATGGGTIQPSGKNGAEKIHLDLMGSNSTGQITTYSVDFDRIPDMQPQPTGHTYYQLRNGNVVVKNKMREEILLRNGSGDMGCDEIGTGNGGIGGGNGGGPGRPGRK